MVNKSKNTNKTKLNYKDDNVTENLYNGTEKLTQYRNMRGNKEIVSREKQYRTLDNIGWIYIAGRNNTRTVHLSAKKILKPTVSKYHILFTNLRSVHWERYWQQL